MPITTNKAEIEELQKRIIKLQHEAEEKQTWWNSLSDAQKIAETLHTKQCHINHTDGCSFYYEKWDNPGFEKKRYLTKVEKLLNTGVSVDLLIEIIEAM